MAKAKTLKKILSGGDIRRGERLEKTRAESVAQLREERQRNDVLLKPDAGYDVTNAEAQAGRILSRQEIMKRLQRLNPDLQYETSLRYPDHGGIYSVTNQADPVTGIAPWKRFICGIPNGPVTEFAIRLTVPDVIPDTTVALHWQTIQKVDNQVPGWRSILLRLIMEGLITPSGAERQFHITEGRSSQRWQEAVN